MKVYQIINQITASKEYFFSIDSTTFATRTKWSVRTKDTNVFSAKITFIIILCGLWFFFAFLPCSVPNHGYNAAIKYWICKIVSSCLVLHHRFHFLVFLHSSMCVYNIYNFLEYGGGVYAWLQIIPVLVYYYYITKTQYIRKITFDAVLTKKNNSNNLRRAFSHKT